MATETTTATMTATETPEISEKKARMNEINAQVEQGVHDVVTGGRLQDYLDTVAKFNQYGYGNNMLIMQQNPEATNIAGFNQWQQQNRQVKTGEKGITILAPDTFVAKDQQPQFNKITNKPVLDENGVQKNEEVTKIITYFKPVKVFDVKQTYGKALPTPQISELDGKVKDFGLFFDALKESTHFKVELADLENGKKGSCNYTQQLITINENMNEVDIVKAAIQGISISNIRDLEAAKFGDMPRLDPETVAIQAEAVAYTVCKHYGIDPPDLNVERVAAWGENKEFPELKSLLEDVRSNSNDFIKSVDEKIITLTRDVTQEVTADIPPPPQAETSKPFGSVKYNEIENRKHLNVNTEDVPKITQKLEAEGIKFSGIERDNGKTTIAVEMADFEAVRNIEKSINIIGNFSFKDIAQKNYFDHDHKTAEIINAALTEQGVEFSGRIGKTKTTFTVDTPNVEKFKEIEQAVTGQQELDIKSHDKPAQVENISLGEMPVDVPPPPLSEPPPPVKPEKAAEVKAPEKVTEETAPAKAEKPVKSEKSEPVKAEKAEKPKRQPKQINKRIRDDAAAKKTAPKKETPEKSKSKVKAGQDLG